VDEGGRLRLRAVGELHSREGEYGRKSQLIMLPYFISSFDYRLHSNNPKLIKNLIDCTPDLQESHHIPQVYHDL